MTTVPQYGIKVPMLLGGRDAAALQSLLAPLGFTMQIAAERVGVASAIKMCRSVMIKGLESLLVESLTSARAYGVEDRVLASLHETFPELDWEEVASYMVSRTALHGKRRAEEMREVAVTVREDRPRAVDGVGDGRAAGLDGEAEGNRRFRPGAARTRTGASTPTACCGC